MSYLVPKITPGPVTVVLSFFLAVFGYIAFIFCVIITILSRDIKKRYICDRVVFNLLNYLKQATSYWTYL